MVGGGAALALLLPPRVANTTTTTPTTLPAIRSTFQLSNLPARRFSAEEDVGRSAFD